VIFISGGGGQIFRVERNRVHRAHGGKDEEKRRYMQRSRDDQNGRVTETVVKQPASQLPKDDPSHRAAQTHEAGDRADGTSRKRSVGKSSPALTTLVTEERGLNSTMHHGTQRVAQHDARITATAIAIGVCARGSLNVDG
jgi:hypothetical protein